MFSTAQGMSKRAKVIEARQIGRCRALLALCALLPAFVAAAQAAQQSPAQGPRQNVQDRNNAPPAEQPGAGHGRIEELFVIGRKTSGLRGDTATTATLLDAELKDIPLNIGVIPRGLIELVNARDTRRVIEQNASVVTRTGHVQSFQGIFIRGFSNNGELNGRLKNGVPFYGVDSPIADNSALERVEVLKGAAGLLFGAASPGGVLNYVYKAPQQDSAYSIDITAAEFDRYRTDLDATGALIADVLSYRFTLGFERNNSWQDFVYYDELAPTLQVQARLGERTGLYLLAESIAVDSNPSNQDTVFSNGRSGTPIELPIKTYLGHANDYAEEKTEQLQLTLNHQFTSDLGLMAQFGSNTTGREQGNTGYMGFGGAPTAAGDVRRFQFDQRRTSDGRYAALHLTWAGEAWGLAHKALAGVNASENEMFNINGFSRLSAPFAGPFVPGGVLPAFTSVNIYNPVIAEYPHLRNFSSSPPFSHLRWVYRDRGLNLQDLVSYAPWNIKVLLGLRYSESELSFKKDTLHSGAQRPNPRKSSSADKWIPRLGVMWSATSAFDMFASYGESFNPQFNVAQGPDNTLLTDPEIGEQFEAGIRLRPFDERLSIALSAYQLRRRNVVRPNPDVPNTSVLDGEQQSRGVELDIAGSLSDAIEMYLSYAYIDTEILRAARAADNGARFPAIPRHKLVFWTEWNVWNGYSIAYGLDYQDAHNADLAGAAVVDGRSLHELRLRKTFSLEAIDISVEFAGRNLSDEVWYQNASTPIFIKRGEPRNFTATVRLDF